MSIPSGFPSDRTKEIKKIFRPMTNANACVYMRTSITVYCALWYYYCNRGRSVACSLQRQQQQSSSPSSSSFVVAGRCYITATRTKTSCENIAAQPPDWISSWFIRMENCTIALVTSKRELVGFSYGERTWYYYGRHPMVVAWHVMYIFLVTP